MRSRFILAVLAFSAGMFVEVTAPAGLGLRPSLLSGKLLATPHPAALPFFALFFVELAGLTAWAVRGQIRKSGRVTASWLRDQRRYAAVATITAAAIVTQPDVVSQLLVAIPAYCAYELLIATVAMRQAR